MRHSNNHGTSKAFVLLHLLIPPYHRHSLPFLFSQNPESQTTSNSNLNWRTRKLRFESDDPWTPLSSDPPFSVLRFTSGQRITYIILTWSCLFDMYVELHASTLVWSCSINSLSNKHLHTCLYKFTWMNWDYSLFIRSRHSVYRHIWIVRAILIII